jgi:hypothetical protein
MLAATESGPPAMLIDLKPNSSISLDPHPKPLISAGKTQIPPGYAVAIRVPAEWDNASDALLESLVQRIERRWKVIVIMMTDFIEGDCKNRWMVLTNLKRLR